MRYLKNIQYALGEYEEHIHAACEQYQRQGWINQLWQKDTTLWVDCLDDQSVLNRLGWLDCDQFTVKEKRWSSIVASALDDGLKRCLLLGMGGSSLAPEVFQKTFTPPSGLFELEVLDNTASSAIKRLTQAQLKETLFVVSSKSGTTIETESLQRYYFNQVQESGSRPPGDHFIAITDQGSQLQKLANEHKFRACLINPSDIGGRYSALSQFGLFPAALLGINTVQLIQNAHRAQTLFAKNKRWEQNPGFHLGVALGELAKSGRDKLTLLLAREFQSLGNWIEQLVAESTGKQGCGIVPIVSEPLMSSDLYADDRIFVSIALKGEINHQKQDTLEALKNRGHPVIQWVVPDLYALGAEFFLWEVATAFAGAVLSINPFDEPNVQESKQTTGQILTQAQNSEITETHTPRVIEQGLVLFGSQTKQATIKEIIQIFLDGIEQGDYFSILAYLPLSLEFENCSTVLRQQILSHKKVATTAAYGPRYLHSTGQLHKGGQNNGVYLLITTEHPEDIVIPGKRFTFNQLNRAQALGDYEVLRKLGRRVLRIHLENGVEAGLVSLQNIFSEVL